MIGKTPLAQYLQMTTVFPDVAYEFLDVFARFEDALKRNGFLRNRRAAEADWDAFAGSLDNTFYETIRVAPEASTVVGLPPKILDSSLSWIEGEPVTDVISLFKAIRRARNNLFHGNKFIGDPNGDARSIQLLNESIWLMNKAGTQNEKIARAIGIK